MRKKSKSRISRQDDISKVLSSSKNNETILNNYFTFLSANDIYRGVSRIKGVAKDHVSLTKRRKNNLHNLVRHEIFFDKSLAWCLGIIKEYKREILEFKKLEGLLLENILNDNAVDAFEVLDEIDQILGFSIWSSNVRGTLSYLSGEEKDMQSLYDEIVSNSKFNQFAKALIHQRFYYFREAMTQPNMSDVLENNLKRSFSDDLYHYLFYKFVNKKYNYEYDLESIYNFEKRASVVDIYMLVTETALLGFIFPLKDLEGGRVADICKRYSQIFDSGIPRKIANGYGIKSEINWDPTVNKLESLYYSGKYQDCIDLYFNEPSLSYNFSSFELIARSSAILGFVFLKSNFQDSLLFYMVDVLQRNENYEDSAHFIEIVSNSFLGISWFYELHLFVEREAKASKLNSYLKMQELSVLIADMDTPRKLEYLCDLQKDFFYKFLEAKPVSKKLFKYTSDIKDGEILQYDDLDIDAFYCNKAKKYMLDGLYDESLKILKELICSENVVIANEAIRYLGECYSRLNMPFDLAELFVNSILGNKNKLSLFDTEKICEMMEDYIAGDETLLPLMTLSFHSRYVDNKFDSNLKYAFECFLSNNNIDSPIEIFDIKDRFLENHIFYFLEYICTPENMKHYLFFDNSNQIEECRIAICKLLAEKNIHSKKMQNEIKERTQQKFIIQARKQVEDSRIYVDISQFKGEYSNDIRKMYESYVELCKSDYSAYDDEVTLKKFINIFKDGVAKDSDNNDARMSRDLLKQVELYILDLQLNEKNLVFYKLLQQVRNIFCFGENGLNNHLSTRIRHGLLPTTLLSAVTKENLILPTIASSSSNDYWPNKISLFFPEREIEINKIFQSFSFDYKNFVDKINDSNIQIKVIDQEVSALSSFSSKSDALFNYSIPYHEMYLIQNGLPENHDYSSFLNYSIECFWEKTDDNLLNVRDYFSNFVKDNLNQLIDQLSNDVSAIISDFKVFHEFKNSISNSKFHLNADIEKIKSWFRRSQGNIIDSYAFATAVEIAKSCADVEFVNESISLNSMFYGKTLNQVVDVLYILMENASSKSGLSSRELVVDLRVEEDSHDSLTIYIKNNCSPVDDYKASNEKLDVNRKLLESEDISTDDLQGEGGTGFIKIWKILNKDLDTNAKIYFGFDDDSHFSVRIDILNAGVLKNV